MADDLGDLAGLLAVGREANGLRQTLVVPSTLGFDRAEIGSALRSMVLWSPSSLRAAPCSPNCLNAVVIDR